MAYDAGTYEMSLADKTGELVTTKGKFLIVWRKVRPGQWKIAAYAALTSVPLRSGGRLRLRKPALRELAANAFG